MLRSYRLDDTADVRAIAALREDALEDDAVEAAVRGILKDVRVRGDDAVIELGERFDGVRRDALRLDDDTWNALADACDPAVQQALEAAADRIRAFHAPQRPQPFVLDGGRLERLSHEPRGEPAAQHHGAEPSLRDPGRRAHPQA